MGVYNSVSGTEMSSPYIKPALKLNPLSARRGSVDSHNISLHTAKHSSTNSPQTRQRSSSFGVALPLSKLKAKSLREQILRKSKDDVSTSSSAEALPHSGDSSPEPHLHYMEPQHSQHCQKCKRHVMRQNSLRESLNNPEDELVFDYANGVIRHKERPKTAFGTTFYSQKKTSTSPTTPRRSVKLQLPVCDEQGLDPANTDEPISANDFINQCIIDSQTPRLQPAQKPSTSSTFSKLLEEFMPSKKEDQGVPEIVVVPRRGRSNSLPVISWRDNGTPRAGDSVS